MRFHFEFGGSPPLLSHPVCGLSRCSASPLSDGWHTRTLPVLDYSLSVACRLLSDHPARFVQHKRWTFSQNPFIPALTSYSCVMFQHVLVEEPVIIGQNYLAAPGWFASILFGFWRVTHFAAICAWPGFPLELPTKQKYKCFCWL